MLRRDFSRSLAIGGLLASIGRTSVAQEQTQGIASSVVSQGNAYAAATVHPLATQAALDCFARGGNAIDAAVAASLMLSVVDGHNSGLGGGGLALIRDAKGNLFALDGRERAPLSVKKDTFVRNGKPDPNLSQTGPLAMGTPGLVALLNKMSHLLGKVGWSDSLKQAAEIAEKGFPIDRPMARNIASTAKSISLFPETAKVLLKPDGSAPEEGWTLRQTDLAKTLRSIADQGVDWFYGGPFAELASGFIQSQGGILSKEDFAKYTAESRSPILTNYRGHKVVGFPPPSSGGIHVAQMLIMLERFDLKALFKSSTASAYHLLAEVMKRAMADRAYWLGDADFAEVPLTLLDHGYLADRSKDIDLERSTAVTSHGQPPRRPHDLFEDKKHTTHLTTADAEGNVVALTQTVNTSFGSKMIVPGTGVILNNEMDDFSLAPGVRNAFGLVGSAANAVEPGKRPLSSMSPTIVIDPSGHWRLSCGAAGGPKITTTTLQNVVRVLDLGMSIDEALSAPRIHHQWSPDTLSVEERLPPDIERELQSRGHQTNRVSTLAVAQGVSRGSDGTLTVASDPRVPSSARAK